MLCYAWSDILRPSDNINLGVELFDNIYNLLGTLYVNGLNNLIKRGLGRTYISKQESLSLIKGKINISESIKQNKFIRRRMICEYDDFSEDNTLNQILKATVSVLIKCPRLDSKIKRKLIKLKLYFSHIKTIQLSNSLFLKCKYNKNNLHYRILINISQLIFEGLITNESRIGKNIEFLDFIRDKQMAKLYEKFVLNFYKHHLDKSKYKVHSPRIRWSLNEKINEFELSILPTMQTDIVIENKIENKQLIIDTKYYSQTLIASNWSDIEKIRTNHLFQIYAYVNNSEFLGTINGMLMYPTIQQEIDVDYYIGQNYISIKTLNLNLEWDSICERLLSLVT